MGLLLTTAENLGLHEDPTPWTIPKAEKAMRKRLWWFVAVTTTMLAHSLGKTNLIHPDFYDVPPLTADDFQADTNGDILIQSSRLVPLMQEITSSLFNPKAARKLLENKGLAKELVPPLMLKASSFLPSYSMLNLPT
jgi:hypothetical protein